MSNQVDGNANSDGTPAGLSAPDIMSHVGGPFEPTTNVIRDPFNVVDPFMSHPVAMSAGAEGNIVVQAHVIHDIPVVEPGQDIAGVRDAGTQ
jgi:hypothetical protein